MSREIKYVFRPYQGIPPRVDLVVPGTKLQPTVEDALRMARQKCDCPIGPCIRLRNSTAGPRLIRLAANEARFRGLAEKA